ncbi:MAG TPA: alanyl-tRNA editing protein [Kofleriaceae bacterium]|nr:alanyl-tRNA editing protein [Kofleriaceae bacterium]
MTRRLFHEDAYLRRFDATIVALANHRDRPAVILDRTAFYPEAGGQLGDRGTLGGVAVVDTQEQDDGTILHVLAAPDERLVAGAPVTGELDWARRRQHMAQHTAQHLLSGTLLDRAQAPTASARLGESALTIDVARDRIPEAELARAEDLANDLIDDDLAIRAWFPDPGELAAMKLRRDPKVDANIRVVAIGDFDYSPCGGTHCERTSQLGTVRIIGAERYKGMTRVTFTAGRRARAELFSRDQILRGLSAQFSCGPAEVPAAIDKLKRTAEAADHELVALRNRLANVFVDQLVGALPDGAAAVAALPVDAELMRSIAAKLVSAGCDAILCAPDPQGTPAIMMRAPGSTLDCGALWKQVAAKLGGRGGGRAERAEGKLTGPIADWPQLIAGLLSH